MGGGFEYGSAGITHHALEDVGIMRLLPRVTVLAPADAAQARSATEYAQNVGGPVYLRLGKDERRQVPELDGSFDPSGVNLTRQGNTGLVLAMGGLAAEAAAAVDALAARGLSCTFGVVAAVAPPPASHLEELLDGHAWVATVEAHVRSGGLGSIVDEVIAASRRPTPHLLCAVDDPLDSCGVGDEAFFLEHHHLSASRLEHRIFEFAESIA
jgi:transketolase